MKLDQMQAWDAQIGVMKKALAVLGPKRKDYSGGKEPFSNFYKSEFFGVEPWRGALIRLSDKLSRIQQLAEKGGQGDVKDESLLDTAADAVNYVCIVLGLIIEAVPDTDAKAFLAKLEAEAAKPWTELFTAAVSGSDDAFDAQTRQTHPLPTGADRVI